MRARFFLAIAIASASVFAGCFVSESDYVGGDVVGDAGSIDSSDDLETDASHDSAQMTDGNESTDSGVVDANASDCGGANVYFNPANGHCYEVVSLRSEWTPAEDDCVGWGGHLVQISDDAEQEFVRELPNGEAYDSGSFWIGLDSIDSPDGSPYNFSWIDGEPYGSYKKFVAGQPNGKQCVAEYANAPLAPQWDDFQCVVEDPYVCER